MKTQATHSMHSKKQEIIFFKNEKDLRMAFHTLPLKNCEEQGKMP